jgi:hypothetical protein
MDYLVNRKGCGRKWPWPNSRHSDSCLEGLRNVTGAGLLAVSITGTSRVLTVRRESVNTYQQPAFVGPRGERSVGRARYGLEDNIKMTHSYEGFNCLMAVMHLVGATP